MTRFWSWLSLFALVKARTSIICPLTEEEAVDQFNVLCTSIQPCENVDIYCPANAYTDLLWVDCNGAHACANMTVYSSVSSRVRCRGRTDACVNVQYYCGDVQDAVGEQYAALFDEQSDNSDSISCKFRHLATRVTQESFFGCYGDQIGECTLKAMAENAFTNGQIYCGTTNGVPCAMECLTSTSCTDNEFECAADPSLCQCEPASNCASVILTETSSSDTTTSQPETTTTSQPDTTTTLQPETTTTIISTTESTDLPPEARQPTFYYVSMENDDYLNTMILAANRCNVYQEQSFKVSCSDVDTGVNTGVVKYFSDEYCTEPATNSDSSNEYTCMLINNEAKTQIASISRYTIDGVNTCTNENQETIMASAAERSTYYLSVENCVAYSNQESVWHQYACSEGVLVHSLYNTDDCSDESLISSNDFTNGECVVENDAHTYYWQVNCTVRGELFESSSTTTTTALQTTQSTTAETTTSVTEETYSSTDVSTTTTTEQQTSSTETITTTSVAAETSTEVSTEPATSTSAETSTETPTSTSVSTSESSVESTSTSTSVETTSGEVEGYGQNNGSSNGLETWQLILVVVLSCVIALLGAFFIVIAVRRLRNNDEQIKKADLAVADEENQLMNDTQDSQVMEPDMSKGDGLNKSISVQSRELLPPLAGILSPSGDNPVKLETGLTGFAAPTPSEGDKITTKVGPAALLSPTVPSEGDATGKPGVDQV